MSDTNDLTERVKSHIHGCAKCSKAMLSAIFGDLPLRPPKDQELCEEGLRLRQEIKQQKQQG